VCARFFSSTAAGDRNRPFSYCPSGFRAAVYWAAWTSRVRIFFAVQGTMIAQFYDWMLCHHLNVDVINSVNLFACSIIIPEIANIIISENLLPHLQHISQKAALVDVGIKSNRIPLTWTKVHQYYHRRELSVKNAFCVTVPKHIWVFYYSASEE